MKFGGGGREASHVHYVRSSARRTPHHVFLYMSARSATATATSTSWRSAGRAAAGHARRERLGLAELAEHRVDGVERCVDLLPDLVVGEGSVSIHEQERNPGELDLGWMDSYLGTREDDLARHENEQDNLGLDHPVDQTREELRSG